MSTPSFGVRLKLAFSILGDPALAQRVLELGEAKPLALPAKPEKKPEPPPPAPKGPSYEDGARMLLSLLQRQGRLVDFLQQDIQSASDEDVASAARVIHEGCRETLERHLPVVPLWDDDEGAKTTVDAGYDPNALKLTGNVAGKGPWKGEVRHRGWRAKAVTLPAPQAGHDASAIAPAEIEV